MHWDGIAGEIKYGAMSVDRLLQLQVALTRFRAGECHDNTNLGKAGPDSVVESEEASHVEVALGACGDVV
jgi:hypothetical protein